MAVQRRLRRAGNGRARRLGREIKHDVRERQVAVRVVVRALGYVLLEDAVTVAVGLRVVPVLAMMLRRNSCRRWKTECASSPPCVLSTTPSRINSVNIGCT